MDFTQDLAAIFEAEFCVQALLWPGQPGQKPINGHFNEPAHLAELGSEVGHLSLAPTYKCLSSDLEGFGYEDPIRILANPGLGIPEDRDFTAKRITPGRPRGQPDRAEGGLRMDSPRKIIRHAVGALLTGKTSVGNKVHINPVDDLHRQQLPALVIFGLKEAKHTDVLLDEEGRWLILVVEARTGDKAPIADFLDDLSFECERILMDSDNLGITAEHLRIEDLEFEDWELARDAQGYLIQGVAATKFRIKYAWRQPDADYNLSDFLTIHAKTQPQGENPPQPEFRVDLNQE